MKNIGRKIVGTTGQALYTIGTGALLVGMFSIPHLKHPAHALSHHYEEIMKNIEQWKKAKD